MVTDQGYIKNVLLLDFKWYYMLPCHQHENETLTNNYYDSQRMIYQTKNIASGIQEWNQEKTCFKLLKLNNLMYIKCFMSILYP